MHVCIRTLTASLALLGLSNAAVLAQQSGTSTATKPAESSAQAQPGSSTEASPSERYGSYEQRQGEFAGTIAGDYTAEQLIGRDVVGPDGDTVANIADLLISEDDRVNKVVLDVGGFLGIGSKPVAVDIDQLERPSGEDEAFGIAMSRDELQALPQFERSDDGWMML